MFGEPCCNFARTFRLNKQCAFASRATGMTTRLSRWEITSGTQFKFKTQQVRRDEAGNLTVNLPCFGPQPEINIFSGMGDTREEVGLFSMVDGFSAWWWQVICGASMCNLLPIRNYWKTGLGYSLVHHECGMLEYSIDNGHDWSNHFQKSNMHKYSA